MLEFFSLTFANSNGPTLIILTVTITQTLQNKQPTKKAKHSSEKRVNFKIQRFKWNSFVQINMVNFKYFSNYICRRSHQMCSVKEGVLKNFVIFTGNTHLCWILFLIKHRYFLVSTAKFLKTFESTYANCCFYPCTSNPVDT